MKNTSLYLVILSLSLLGLQAACSKKITPVSGAIEMEQDSEQAGRPGFDRNARNGVDRQSASPFSDRSEGIREEAIGQGALGEEALVGTKGARAGLKETTSSMPMISIDLGDIFFEYNMAVLKGASENALRENANNLLRHPGTRIRISGHTDDRGSSEYNLALGERRARTVKQFLEAFGIEPSRIEIISYGEEKPFCSEQDEFCWKQNRRVHFSIKP